MSRWYDGSCSKWPDRGCCLTAPHRSREGAHKGCLGIAMHSLSLSRMMTPGTLNIKGSATLKAHALLAWGPDGRYRAFRRPGQTFHETTDSHHDGPRSDNVRRVTSHHPSRLPAFSCIHRYGCPGAKIDLDPTSPQSLVDDWLAYGDDLHSRTFSPFATSVRGTELGPHRAT